VFQIVMETTHFQVVTQTNAKMKHKDYLVYLSVMEITVMINAMAAFAHHAVMEISVLMHALVIIALLAAMVINVQRHVTAIRV